jgi:hypothetical protein
MIYWLLLVWICAGPGDCYWELRGQYRIQTTCIHAMENQDRYSTCVEVTVPVPGTPTR